MKRDVVAFDGDGAASAAAGVARADRPSHDWDRIARALPYYGVVSQERFRGVVLDTDDAHAFEASGRAIHGFLMRRFQRHFAATPGGRALDVGSGLGRLSVPMARCCTHVTGYDVSAEMTAQATERAAAAGVTNIRFTTTLPDGPFDWVQSYLVFQHIPPHEGMALLRRVLQRVAPGGFVSLQVPIARERAGGLALRRAVVRWVQGMQAWRARRGQAAVEHLIRMYDYDLGAVTRVFHAAGFSDLRLAPVRQGGHHGVWILSRRSG